MTYATEFPEFVAGMPAIPTDYVDTSWHNDACPSFHVAGNVYGLGVTLWVDHADKAERENGADVDRFMIHRNGSPSEYGGTSESWEEAQRLVLVERIAMRLRSNIGDELSALQWQEMRAANVGAAENVCASHDYCDANMPMAAAFESVMGRPFLPVGFETDDAKTPSDDDVALWNEAWHVATPAYFTATNADDIRFDAWRLTGKDCDDLGAALNDPDLKSAAGRLYQPGHILGPGYFNKWHVVCGNQEYLGESLFDAESFLWDSYAKTESANAPPPAPEMVSAAALRAVQRAWESDRAALELTVEGLTAIVGALSALPLGAFPSTPEGVAVVAAYQVAREALGE